MKLQVDNLTCTYGDKAVLGASSLVFEAGNVYFLLGKSGAGKSTFLEAMGLMTDTMTSDSRVYFIKNEERFDLKDLWNQGDDVLSDFRANNYSFIFQSTNLMSNFSAGENMCLTLMLSGLSFEESKQKVLELMTTVELDESVFDKSIMNLSGGQRQRLAFVRAISAPHQILYCDEPTGNLDVIIANKLMTLLKNEVKSKQKIAIIVSHSIPLALQFADQICCAEFDNGIGTINRENSLVKDDKGWKLNDVFIDDANSYLMQKIS